jgi:hypothetical protein
LPCHKFHTVGWKEIFSYFSAVFQTNYTRMNKRLALWSITVGLGGFLFGLDVAVISGAEQAIQKLFTKH